MDWLNIALVCFTMTVMYGSMLFILVSEVAACIRRWRSRRDKLLAVDRLLETVDDVPYQRLPAGDGDDDDEGCVICLAEYEHGEGRFVLPGCAHTFHRDCIAPWLRQGNGTCPVCRATVRAAAAEQHRVIIDTAENMV
ncbi:hypothetical protein EJB05_29954, partial [Eragrostis curvula]